MQTAATSDRAIVIPKCPCGCLSGDCVVTQGDPNDEPSQVMQIAMADLSGRDIRTVIQEGWVADSVLADVEKRRARHMATDKELRELIKLAEQQDFTVVEEGSSIKWTNAEGGTVSTPSRVAPGRAFQNIKAQLRRLGLDIPRKDGRVTSSVTPPTAETPETPVATTVTESTTPVLTDEVGAVYAAIATLTEFVAGHQHDDGSEWQSLCEGLEAELATMRAERDQAIKERDEALFKLQTTKSTLRDLFN